MRHKLFTFILAYIVWVIFAGRITFDVLMVGFIASLITALLFSNMLFHGSGPSKGPVSYLRRLGYIFMFIPVFFYEALVSALEVTRHIFERHPSFSPGIVKVKTHLTDVSALSILANLITLTPGTLTLDFDISERAYYIHWIDVTTREEAETRKKIIELFERWLGVIFQ